MLSVLIKKLLPKTYEKIATEEADRMCNMMATGGYLQSETTTDVLVFGLIRTVPKNQMRK